MRLDNHLSVVYAFFIIIILVKIYSVFELAKVVDKKVFEILV